VKLVRWVAVGLALGAAAAFAAELMRPKAQVRGSSGYTPPPPSRDHRVVLPDTQEAADRAADRAADEAAGDPGAADHDDTAYRI
jgi:hypothetical protein